MNFSFFILVYFAKRKHGNMIHDLNDDTRFGLLTKVQVHQRIILVVLLKRHAYLTLCQHLWSSAALMFSSSLTKIINLSLESGMFPDDWKCGVVLPLPNKAGLDLLYKNYKTVSNLQYPSKLTERVVFHQIHLHMEENDIYPVMQSSYRQHHSTELKVMKDHRNSLRVTI